MSALSKLLSIASITAVAAEVVAVIIFQARAPVIEPYTSSSASSASQARQSDASAIAWSVDPTSSGENLPPAGRSLFDFLIVERSGRYDIPFPFTALLGEIAHKAQCGSRIETRESENGGRSPPYLQCFKSVLIPLGRSLQRTAAGSEFFKYPRVVYAVESDWAASPGAALLQDRLYLGYHEKANVIEVISYNEAAGRFEFQVIKDYREGGSPQVFYANRAVCTACHQNHAPIFSRQVWDETNANPRIAARLMSEGRDYHGVKVDRGVDIPQAIDNATDRANLYAAYQLLWQKGCGADTAAAIRCRASALIAALQYRLTGESGFEREADSFRTDFEPVVKSAWMKNWSNGLRVPDADIPNRDPTQAEESLRFAHVAARFDPLIPRSRSELWQWDTDRYRIVKGIGEFLSNADIEALDRHLVAALAPEEKSTRTYTAPCDFQRKQIRANTHRIIFVCRPREATPQMELEGRVEVSANGQAAGTVERLVLPDGESLSALSVSGDSAQAIQTQGWSLELGMARGRLHARRGNGNSLLRIALRARSQPPATGEVEITESNDFSTLKGAVQALADAAVAGRTDVLSEKPFRRAAVMPVLFTRLGVAQKGWCCVDAAGLPEARLDQALNDKNEVLTARNATPELRRFYQYCARCHETNERVPPNFLRGNTQQVSSNLKHCAERIYYRLSMWQTPEASRGKSPMPPPLALHELHVSPAEWPISDELGALRNYARSLLSSDGKRGLTEAHLRERSYESLRSCLPASG